MVHFPWQQLAGSSGDSRLRKRVLVVDDVPFFRTHVGEVVQSAGYEALLAASGEEALALTERMQHERRPISLAIVDILMPQGQIDGVAAARLLVQRYRVPCVMLTSVDDAPTRAQCHLIGAAGYLVKDATLTDERIQEAIAAVVHPSGAASHRQFAASPSAPPPLPADAAYARPALAQWAQHIRLQRAYHALTPAQQRVADLVRSGMTNQEIAAALGVSVATINTHVQEILHRLGIASRRDLLPHRLYDSLYAADSEEDRR